MPLPFQVPDVQDNADGWGPSTVPAVLLDVPFAPFGKGDKIGRAADWTASAYNKYQGRYGQNQGVAVFNFFANEEEDSFHLVDSKPKPQPKFGQRKFQQQKQAQLQRQQREKEQHQNDPKLKKKALQQRNQYQQNRDNQQRQAQYSCSVDIRPEWAVKEQIPFASLTKLSTNVGEGEDVAKCGSLEFYDKAYDRVAPKQEKPLERTKRAFRSASTSDDPVIRRLASAGAARVFVTDNILTTLMCIRSSIYSWDIVITRTGDKLFLDLRPDSNLNLLTVNETAPDALPEDKDNINGVQQLGLESTAVNQSFSQQVLLRSGSRRLTFDEPNPFSADDDEAASRAYRYRRWTLNKEDGVDIVVRCELDGAIEQKGEEQLLSIKALNEFDLRATEWRKRLESQRGAMLALETKNNKNKMAKWTASALLAGADMIKLGYVSRAGPKDNQNHVILGTQVCKPKDFAGQINLEMVHCWGVVRAIVDMMMAMDEGKYLLVKDPNKELLRLYAIPEDAFESNYAEEPLPDNEEVPTTLAAPPKAEDAADE